MDLNKQRDQLGTSVSYQNFFRTASGITCDVFAKLCVFRVRICGNGIQFFGQSCADLFGNAKWIYVGSKSGDLIFRDTKIFFYL